MLIMKITFIDAEEWRNFVKDPKRLIDALESEVFIVRDFMSDNEVSRFREFCLTFSMAHEASWHPCLDGCPDYHRIHHQYPKAHVRSTQHAYYFHPWNDNFSHLMSFEGFNEIFALKARAAGAEPEDFFENIPSSGPIARIVCHQYPKGGGGQEEHIDPVSPFAKVQTIIQASSCGEDYERGGFYINHPKFGILNIDSLTKKGDLILASPGARHGVALVDSHESLSWDNHNGRWIIMPIIIHSDHVKDASIRPKRTANL